MANENWGGKVDVEVAFHGPLIRDICTAILLAIAYAINKDGNKTQNFAITTTVACRIWDCC